MDHRADLTWMPTAEAEKFRPERWAAAVERARLGGRHWEKITDVYIALLYVAVLGAFTAGLVSLAGHLLQSPVEMSRSDRLALVSTESLVGALGGLLGAWIGRVTCALGPAAVDRAQAFWWLRLPVEIAPFIRRGVHGRLLVGGLLGTAAWLPVAAGLIESQSVTGQTGTVDVLIGALVSGCLVWLMMAVCAVAQTYHCRGLLRRIFDWVPAAVAALLAVEVLTRALGSFEVGVPVWWMVSPAALPSIAMVGDGPSWLVLTIVALLAACLTRWADSRWEKVTHRDLIEAGDASAHLGGAMIMLNVRELGAALTTRSHTAARIRPRWLQRRRRTLKPMWAWALADLLVVLRAPRSVFGVLAGWAVVAVVAVSEAGNQTVFVAAAVVVGSVMAVRSVTTAADALAGMGQLQRLLPVGRNVAWIAHTLAPAVLLIPWGAATGLVVATVSFNFGDPSWWMTVAVGVVSGWALSASVVRTATQPPLDWGVVMQAAQTGRTFGPVAGSLMHGTDTAVLAALPLALTAVLSMIPWAYLLITVVVAAIAWAAAATVADR